VIRAPSLKHTISGKTITAAGGDLRTLPPQATASTEVPIAVTIPVGASAGDYEVFLGVPDVFPATSGTPDFAIRFANADDAAAGQSWNAGTAMFALGTTVHVL
jgi:hypothetical protein